MIDKFKGGSIVPSLSAANLKLFKIYLPGEAEMIRVIDYLGSLFSYTESLIKTYKEKINLLNELKLSLLNEAFLGRLLRIKKILSRQKFLSSNIRNACDICF
jgi:hypothetical protein